MVPLTLVTALTVASALLASMLDMEGFDVGFLGPPGAAVGRLRRLLDLLELIVCGGGELGLAARCASTRTSSLWRVFWSAGAGRSVLDIVSNDDEENAVSRRRRCWRRRCLVLGKD